MTAACGFIAPISAKSSDVGKGSTTASDKLAETHEINVTPFIDVMLVLLIIFMVAAPLATVDVPVELPVVDRRAPDASPTRRSILTLKSDLSFVLKDKPVTRGDLAKALDEATSGKKDERVFLRADKSVPYGELMQVHEPAALGGVPEGRVGRAGATGLFKERVGEGGGGLEAGMGGFLALGGWWFSRQGA